MKAIFSVTVDSKYDGQISEFYATCDQKKKMNASLSLCTGALIYLLDMFCNSTHPQVRAQTAELFAKMTADKLVGPKVRI